MVRLKEDPNAHVQIEMSGFNSTMVRLKARLQNRDAPLLTCFNSTMVRLKVAYSDTLSAIELCFNSTMVRLKAIRQLLRLRFREFQFHNVD